MDDTRFSYITSDDRNELIVLDEKTGQYYQILKELVPQAQFSAQWYEYKHYTSESDLNAIKRYPRVMLVILYGLLNLFAEILLHVLGWHLIRLIRNKSRTKAHHGRDYSPMISEVISAVRLATLFPWVSNRCTVRSVGVYWLACMLGTPGQIQIGGVIEPFDPHMWTEVDGVRIDPTICQHAVCVFSPLQLADSSRT